MSDQNQTIIIKKIKKGGGGHHADFVTAMMAFFLLMWLLNATEAENLAGLADYFAPTVGVKDEMGIGFRGGKSALSEGIGADRNTNKGVVFGGVPTGPITKVTERIEERTEEVDQEQIKIILDQTPKKEDSNTDAKGTDAGGEADEEFSEIEQAMNRVVNDTIKDKRLEDGSIEVRRVPEGLALEIKDVNGNSMFVEHTAEMLDPLKDALVQLAKVLRSIPNNLAVVGHTSSAPVQGQKTGYGKWNLSSDRANQTRLFLEKNAVPKEQFSRIEGRSDNTPYDRRRPESPVNNRINIIMLKNKDTPNHKKSSPDSLFLNLKGSQTKGFIKKAVEQEEKFELRKNEEYEQIINEAIGIPETKKAPATNAPQNQQ